MGEPTEFPSPTLHRFAEGEVERICRFVLKDEYKTKEELNTIIKAIVQEARRDAVFPPTNHFGDQLCDECRVRYHQPQFVRCLECNFIKRSEAAQKALTRDSLGDGNS